MVSRRSIRENRTDSAPRANPPSLSLTMSSPNPSNKPSVAETTQQLPVTPVLVSGAQVTEFGNEISAGSRWLCGNFKHAHHTQENTVENNPIWSTTGVGDETASESGNTEADIQWMRKVFPVMFPSLPEDDGQPVNLVDNPFTENSKERYTTLAYRVQYNVPLSGVVDGYIKFHFRALEAASEPDSPYQSHDSWVDKWSRFMAVSHGMMIWHLPPNFAMSLEMDHIDQTLWSFHIHAYTPGRMIVEDNYFGQDLIPIAMGDAGARHALLCHMGTYVLDYQPTEHMRQRINFHYRMAVWTLGSALRKKEVYRVGNEDAVVASINLLLTTDIVDYENRHPRQKIPLWLSGANAASHILDNSDPGYRYWKPENVQSGAARRAHANWVAYVGIMAQPVTPLRDDFVSLDRTYQWLLEGTKEDVHKIQGITGLSPKLLHIFCQITHLAVRLQKTPAAEIMIKLAADRLMDQLRKFWQWSTPSVEPQVNDLDVTDTINLDPPSLSPATVTELSAYAWIPAAEVYLLCRVYRKPRSDPEVIKSLNLLAHIIGRLPCSGPLFTSQSPFFPVFLLAAVSPIPQHRETARNWFENVIQGAQCRSSVPPVWAAIQHDFRWRNDVANEMPVDENTPLASRSPWWEIMVDRLIKEHGVLSLV